MYIQLRVGLPVYESTKTPVGHTTIRTQVWHSELVYSLLLRLSKTVKAEWKFCVNKPSATKNWSAYLSHSKKSD